MAGRTDAPWARIVVGVHRQPWARSSVKDMISGILSTRFRTAQTRGNWNTTVGLPLSLLSMERTTEIGVFELGINHPGRCRLCRMTIRNAG